MKTATQLNVSMPNMPGWLAKVTDRLRGADVNIEAVFQTEGHPNSMLHLIVDDLETAKMVLKEIGPVTTNEVIGFTMKNKPGAIAQIGRLCAGAGINIRTIYATTSGSRRGDSNVYVHVDDQQKAVEVFKKAKL